MTPPRLHLWDAVDYNGPMRSPYLGPCWIWTAQLDPKGYGRLYAGPTGGRLRVKAHRLAYELVCGPIPDGLEIDHLCRNRACINPAHLEPVTHAENARRGRAGENRRGLTHCKRGHEFTTANTYRNNGKRVCRVCARMHDAQRKASLRSLRHAA